MDGTLSDYLDLQGVVHHTSFVNKSTQNGKENAHIEVARCDLNNSLAYQFDAIARTLGFKSPFEVLSDRSYTIHPKVFKCISFVHKRSMQKVRTPDSQKAL